MGIGDPDHHHPLNFIFRKKGEATCFRCELPIEEEDRCYGCARCDHFVHEVCLELPHDMRHPLHPQHSLTLFPSPPNLQMDCNGCHQPCLGGGYVYHCQACLEFQLHLKCFLTLNLEEKHHHPLTLHELDICDLYLDDTCHICGFVIDDIDSYTFACRGCEFLFHFDCTFLPPTVKGHHVHELTFRYNYPKESDQAYCDVCEDKDGKELDRTLSYYYCKICDYIAHVHCVTTKPATVTTQFFVHEHPMIYSRKPRRNCECACNKQSVDSHYFCSQCDYNLHKSCAKFPQFIKHPRHKYHTLSLRSHGASLNIEGELPLCNFCSCKMEHDALILQCMDCDYAEHLSCAVCFRHPYYAYNLLFSARFDHRFRCNACGELGDGYRMSANHNEIQYDLHLECYALPGKIEHGCHSHLLYLISSPTKIRSDSSATFLCDVCRTKADSDFWIYCCKQCNYIAHLKCVVSDLHSGLGSTNNFSSLCSIAECEEGQFIDHVKLDVSILCSRLKHETLLQRGGSIFHDHEFMTPDATDWNQSYIEVLHCPKCERPISTQAYSCINDWMHGNYKATIHNQTPICYEPLALLDDKLIEELYCPICNQLIFPPTYSCAECQLFFHKSCAELPCEYTKYPGHTFVLLSPSMRIDSLSNCFCCKLPIKGYAYVCGSCEIAVDVICALGAPLLKLENQKHNFYSWNQRNYHVKCNACSNPIACDSIVFRCIASLCYFSLHYECALLPYTVSHRIHQHPLVLETRLDLSVDDYVCDVCEKELNPCLWAYRCSDSCGDRATSHVSCIVTSNKKCQFKYDKECRYPLVRDFSLLCKMSLRAAAAALPNVPPDEQFMLVCRNLYVLVDELVDELNHMLSGGVAFMLLKMGQAELLRLIKSPDAFKEKVVEAVEVEVNRIAAKPAMNFAKWSGNPLPQNNLN